MSATPGQRHVLHERLVQSATEIKSCRSVTVVCHSCEAEIAAVMAAADDYAKAAGPELAEPVTVAGVLCRDYPSVVAAMQAEIDRRRVVFLRVEGERDQLREAHERQRLELLQAQGEAAETAAELVRVKQLHADLLGEVKPNGGGYTFRTTGVLLARRYAAANLPLRDDLSHLAGQ